MGWIVFGLFVVALLAAFASSAAGWIVFVLFVVALLAAFASSRRSS